MTTTRALLVAALATSACAHDVRVQTEPAGAAVVVDGVDLGRAPVVYVEQRGRAQPVVVEARAEGFRPARVVVHPSTFSVPVAAAGMGCGALACAGCVGASLALSAASPILVAGVALGLPLFSVPSIAALVLGRQLPDTVVVKLTPEGT